MARHIPGEFVPISVLLPRDPAIRKAGPDAELLYIRGLIYCAQNDSDGFLPEFDIDVAAVGLKNVSRSVQKLITERLWIESPGGWLVRSWVKWNRTLGEQKQLKEAQKEGAMKGNHRRWHKGNHQPDCPYCKAEEEGDTAA